MKHKLYLLLIFLAVACAGIPAQAAKREIIKGVVTEKVKNDQRTTFTIKITETYVGGEDLKDKTFQIYHQLQGSYLLTINPLPDVGDSGILYVNRSQKFNVAADIYSMLQDTGIQLPIFDNSPIYAATAKWAEFMKARDKLSKSERLDELNNQLLKSDQSVILKWVVWQICSLYADDEISESGLRIYKDSAKTNRNITKELLAKFDKATQK